MGIFLEEDEVQELTGRKRYDAQMEALNSMGIEYRKRPDNSIAVLRSCIEKVFNGLPERVMQKKSRIKWENVNA